MKSIYLSSAKQLLSLFSLFLFIIFWGCKKDLDNTSPALDNHLSVDTSQFVIGPHGERILKKNFHIIDSGYKLAIQNGHIYKVEIASGKMAEDFGEYRAGASPNPFGVLTSKGKNITYGNSAGWVAATEWDNTGSNPINGFSATTIVPPLPSEGVSQTFAFWIGLSSETDGDGNIVQPILNYGQAPQATWQNQYQVFNYFYWGSGAALTQPATVYPGNTIWYSISFSGETETSNGESYDYVSNVYNSSGGSQTPTMNITVGNDEYLNGLGTGFTTIPFVAESNSAYVVLEDPISPGIGSSAQYPNNQPYVAVSDIAISTGPPRTFTYPSPLGWTKVYTPGAQNGEYPQIVNTNNNNTSSPGQIDLWYSVQTSCLGSTWVMSVEPGSGGTANVAWEPISGASSYNVEFLSGGMIVKSFNSTTSNPGSGVEFSGIPSGTYTIQVQGVASCGQGPWAAYSSQVPITCLGNTWVMSVEPGTNEADVAWEPISGASSYNVEFVSNGKLVSMFSSNPTNPGGGVEFTGIPAGTYTVSVQGVCSSCGTGLWASYSSQVTIN
jgi:hypothetical protein